MQLIINLVLLVLFVLFLVDAIREYASTSGTTWERLLAVGKDSATILWTRFVGIVATGISSLVWIADALNAPQVASAMSTYGNPKVVASIILAVTIVGELARRRTLSKD